MKNTEEAKALIESLTPLHEALLDALGKEPMPLDEWAMVMSFNLVFN